jgi:HK97 family phage major capsid protein
MNKIEQLKDELNVKRTALAAFLNEVKGKETSADVDKARQLHTEVNDLGAQLKGAQDMAAIEAETKAWENTPANGLNFGSGQPGESKSFTITGQPGEFKSVGEMFTASPEYKSFGSRGRYSVELKTTMTTTAGFAPQVLRNGVVVPSATRTPLVADLIPQGFTSQNAVKYMRESTFTNAAAERAEAGAAAESALAWTEVSSPVASIATFVPVTEEQLEDVAGMQSLINDRLSYMVALREDSELLNGSGSGANLTGILNTSGIQTQARGSDSNQDAIFKAYTACAATGFATPDAIVIHPLNWQAIRLATGSGSGVYLTAPITNADGDFLWGLPIIKTTAIASGTALVGAFRQYSHISRRQASTIEVGYINDNFQKLIRSVRAVERVSLEVYRAAAFCSVTSLS